MNEKPEGPIWIDLSPVLLNQLSIGQVVAITNLAMNRLTMRDWGEIFGEIGVRPELNFVDKETKEEEQKDA